MNIARIEKYAHFFFSFIRLPVSTALDEVWPDPDFPTIFTKYLHIIRKCAFRKRGSYHVENPCN